ncbi:family 10 glycosylhydrolase [Polystyrenella longa]|nr:family 10 glycosylhydrolase [Polystyrenella longa]
MEVDFGKDHGQNLGSLFEVYDADGNVVAGAGFVGTYNSYIRNDRERLHFFLKSAEAKPEVEPLLRVNETTGVYLSDLREQLYARGRSAKDDRFYEWNSESADWNVKEEMTQYDFFVAGKILHVEDRKIDYDGETILDLSDQDLIIGERYYAGGYLFLKTYTAERRLETNQLQAIPWSAYQDDLSIDLEKAIALPLRSDKEFVYSFGQLNGDILAATNTGGVYRFRAAKWEPLVEPIMTTSFQVYAMLNYYDRLLMGHYPTGELYEYDGESLILLEDWPPVLSGVSPSAREAQSLMIYGGDLYVGVWPWAEVWRYDQNQQDWVFAKRMFEHPALTDKVVHPYEDETKGVAEVYNLWGQRVTSLITMHDSLYISTSSKSGFAYDPKFDFLSGEELEDYGRVYRLKQPGQLTVPTTWPEGPQKFLFELDDESMRIMQNGKLIAEQKLSTSELIDQQPQRIVWGRGVYGKLSGDLLSRKSNLDQPVVGAYLNFGKLFQSAGTIPEKQKTIDDALDRFQSSGFNTVYPYVTTTSGKVYYPSELLTENLSADFDCVQYLIDQADNRNLQVFPVFCVLSCGHHHPTGILEQHPEWALRTPEGEPMGHISATNPEARDFITSSIKEFVDRYSTEGILLDYLRYYNRPTLLDAASVEVFDEWKQQQAEQDEAELIQQYKETGITELANQISVAVRRGRPEREIAIYSWGPHVADHHQVAQPWPLWSQRGYIDMVNISGYCYPDNYGDKYLDVFKQRIGTALELNKANHGRADVTFCLGVKTSHGKIQSASWIKDYLHIASELGVDGTLLFTWHTLQPWLDEVDREGYISEFQQELQSP